MKEEPLLLLSDLQKLINQVVLIDYTIIILGGNLMLIDVQVNYYRTNRIVSVDANTLRVEVDRLRSDPSILYYELVGTTDQGRLLIRTSVNAQEILDLYDAYMDQAEEKRKAACGGQLSFEDILGGDSSAG